MGGKLAAMGSAMRSKLDVIQHMLGYKKPAEDKEDLFEEVQEANAVQDMMDTDGWKIFQAQCLDRRKTGWIQKWLTNGEYDAAGAVMDNECKFRAAEIDNIKGWLDLKIDAGQEAKERLQELDEEARR